MSNTLVEISVPAQELMALVMKIEQSVLGYPEKDVLMACVAMALLIACPEINGPKLVEGVKGVCEWMALFSDSDDPIKPVRMN